MMKYIPRKRILSVTVRTGLFALILSLGTLTALVLGETRGLALADLSGASVQAMTASGPRHVLYTALHGGKRPNGIYRSEDNGRTWAMAGSWPGVPINTLTTAPRDKSVLYAGTAGGPLDSTNNVWRSEDGGQTWRNFNIPLPANPAGTIPAVTVVAADPSRPELLYVGTDGQGVYRFKTGEVGYELVGGISLADSHVKNLVVGPDSRLYALTNGGLYVTGGKTWYKLETVPELPVSLAVAPSNGKVLYLGGASSGVYRSTDGGQSWQSISEGLGLMPGAALRVTALAVDWHDWKHVVAATAYGLGSQLAPAGIYSSRDAGGQWTKVADPEGLVKGLTLKQGVIHAATATGLQRYGEPESTSTKKALPPVQTLTKPTGIQTLVLILTVGLGGLVLLGRLEWVVRRIRSAA